MKQNFNICGWYHSHPHITVFPSNVDIKTQSMYQTMDNKFVGLIASVYNQNKKTFVDTIELIGFQSEGDHFIKIPINICVYDDISMIEENLKTLYKIPDILSKEENNLYLKNTENSNNVLCNMSNLGGKLLFFLLFGNFSTIILFKVYLHTMSEVIGTSYLEMIDALECRTELNALIIKKLQNSETVTDTASIEVELPKEEPNE